MRAFLETITPDDGASWALLNRRLEEGIPFEWHHHPEYELTLTLNSRGHRYIGDDIEPYDDGDLVLVGPGVPHSWCSSEKVDAARPHVALVIWFHRDWANGLLAMFPELRDIGVLLAGAEQGLGFGAATRAGVRPLIEAMPGAEPGRRLMLLLDVLLLLCRDPEMQPLANAPATPASLPTADPRIQRVLDRLHQGFAAPVSIPELAELACVSVSAFHRMFRRHTRMTAVQYVTRLRIGRACSLLIATDLPVVRIAEQVGYANLSLFNRQFLALKASTPRDFRRVHRKAANRPPSRSAVE
ncbi:MULTISPECIES: helix-turn-helix domain-containing protein [unclassified Pseudomonas]|uniref:helix-turn-helix domain-containing protein n=1 Tax=unclassified Pseudomonas TaxID=196821 RepID=UPI000DA7D1B0|nr:MULTISPECIES: AraC family transcriptional regulator [unclassified Pseudomonas]MDW3711540.1 AraC family transcriptional regulator [Pseudomonas sp. 2023EL-01195]PZE14641.1 AraC family transcriptional regulator [Pseudomonas sp. 57B-090624]